MKKLFLDLFVYRDGRVSNTIFWSSVGYSVATWIVVHLTQKDLLTPEYLLIYLGIVAAHTGASKWLTSRYSNKVPTK